jgi:hypothetical protein
VQPLTEKDGAFARAAVAFGQHRYAQAQQLLRPCFEQDDEIDNIGGYAQGLDRLLALQALINEKLAAPAAA